MKIYDAFLFYNELDLLDIRLSILNPYVDYFIISECDYTFSGLKKPFNFENNKERYSKYLDKIIYVKNHNSNDTNNFNEEYVGNKKIYYDFISNHFKNTHYHWKHESHWCRDFIHREYVKLGMENCKDDDIVIFGDLDEFPDPNILNNYLNNLDKNKSYVLKLKFMYYFINNENIEDWYGTLITQFKNLKNITLNEIRRNRMNLNIINDAGWHLSFMGGSKKIKEKIQSYGHQEFNNNFIISNIDKNVNENKDLFFRNHKYQTVNLNIYPKNMIDLIKEKYSYLIK